MYALICTASPRVLSCHLSSPAMSSTEMFDLALTPSQEEELGFPLIADETREIASLLGMLVPSTNFGSQIKVSHWLLIAFSKSTHLNRSTDDHRSSLTLPSFPLVKRCTLEMIGDDWRHLQSAAKPCLIILRTLWSSTMWTESRCLHEPFS